MGKIRKEHIMKKLYHYQTLIARLYFNKKWSNVSKILKDGKHNLGSFYSANTKLLVNIKYQHKATGEH